MVGIIYNVSMAAIFFLVVTFDNNVEGDGAGWAGVMDEWG